MKRDSLAFALSGTAFGLLVGWIIGSQQAPRPPAAVVPAADAAAAPSGAPAPPPLDQARATTLEQQASAEPGNASVRSDLGNLYFDAERYDQAAPWYEAALALDPKNTNANTDLGIVYFYLGQNDRALAQIDRALAVEPNHVKALLNQGYIRAIGKQDLVGAAESWERVVALAPATEEGRRAKMGLDGIRAAHQASDGSAAAPSAGAASP